MTLEGLDMGAIKNWLIVMEEDATVMDRGEWIEKHGSTHINTFEKIQTEMFQHGYQVLHDILRGVEQDD
tara:strand:+ start:423 stop:629 length:207 start_codon:yes stop_codon:yes gene_type:complete